MFTDAYQGGTIRFYRYCPGCTFIHTNQMVMRPKWFENFEPFITYLDAEDTGLLGFYVLYSPPRPKKLTHCDMLLRTRSLILILLLIGCLRVTQVSFHKYYFLLFQPRCFGSILEKYICANLSLIALKVLIAYQQISKVVLNEILKLFEFFLGF